jgi:alanine dehydrogenase
MRIISKREVENSLTMREAIEVVRQAFIELSNNTAEVPPRIHLEIKKQQATTLVMPAYLSQTDALACKIVSVFPHNSLKSLPVIDGLVILFDAENGKPLAAIEGGFLTALRTGAASGLATDLLARKSAEVLAVFGAGRQSRAQIEAVCAVRKIKEISVFSRRPEQTIAFVAEMKGKFEKIDFEIAENPNQAVAKADIICAATTSETPVFKGENVKMGTHINGIGSFTPKMQEIDFSTLKRAAKIVVDSRQNALTEAGELVQAIEKKIITKADIYAEIGEIASGLKNGRENENEISFFKSVGNAAQDAAVAKAIYQISQKRNFGVEVDF